MKRPALLLEIIERAILAIPRCHMRKNASKKLSAALTAIEQGTATRDKLAKFGMHDVLRLYDASLFCLMYEADLTVLSRDMTCRVNWWESRLYGRLLAMTMLECVEDIPEILGKEFRRSLSSVVSNENSKQMLTDIGKNLSNFRKRHEKLLRGIRQVAAAHRDHDPKLIADTIEQLDLKSLLKRATELNELLHAYWGAMTQVLQQINVYKEVLKSFSEKGK